MVIKNNNYVNYDRSMLVDDWRWWLKKIMVDDALDYDDWSWWLIDGYIMMLYGLVTSPE